MTLTPTTGTTAGWRLMASVNGTMFPDPGIKPKGMHQAMKADGFAVGGNISSLFGREKRFKIGGGGG